jgi:hypothetical protein
VQRDPPGIAAQRAEWLTSIGPQAELPAVAAMPGVPSATSGA